VVAACKDKNNDPPHNCYLQMLHEEMQLGKKIVDYGSRIKKEILKYWLPKLAK
jgi:hypothetical protein